MNITCIIPARGGSKGLPKKNIINFCGKPLISWSILQSRESTYINSVFVTSDSEEILSIAKFYGAKTIIRPEDIAADNSISESALLHAVDKIEKEAVQKIDLIVFLQATSPLRESLDIDNSIKQLIKENADSLFSAVKLDDFFIWEEKDNKLFSINYDYHNRKRRQDLNQQYLENGSIYVFKPEILRKYNNRLGGRISMFLMDFWKMYEIDSWDDKELCEWIFNRKILKD